MEKWSGKFEILSQNIQPFHPQISLCWFQVRPLAVGQRANASSASKELSRLKEPLQLTSGGSPPLGTGSCPEWVITLA